MHAIVSETLVNEILGHLSELFHVQLIIIKSSWKHEEGLTFTSLWVNSADDKVMIFFLPFSEKKKKNTIRQFMQIVFVGDNMHEISNPLSWGKQEMNFKILSAEFFTQTAASPFSAEDVSREITLYH